MYLKNSYNFSWIELWLSFYHKTISRRIWKTIWLRRRKHWKIHNLCCSNRKRSYQKLIKMEKKLQKIYLIDYNLLIAQDLLQALYQILSTISLKEFIKSNVNTEMMIGNVKLVEFNINIGTVEYTNLKHKLIEYKCLCCNKN